MHHFVDVIHVCTLIQSGRRHETCIGWTVHRTQIWQPNVHHERIVGSAHFGWNKHQWSRIRRRQIRLGVILHPAVFHGTHELRKLVFKLLWRLINRCICDGFSYFIPIISGLDPVIQMWQIITCVSIRIKGIPLRDPLQWPTCIQCTCKTNCILNIFCHVTHFIACIQWRHIHFFAICRKRASVRIHIKPRFWKIGV